MNGAYILEMNLIMITVRAIKNIMMEILLIPCITLILKFDGRLGSFFLKK